MNYTHDDVADALEVMHLQNEFYLEWSQKEVYSPTILSNAMLRAMLEIQILQIAEYEGMNVIEKLYALKTLREKISHKIREVERHLCKDLPCMNDD